MNRAISLRRPLVLSPSIICLAVGVVLWNLPVPTGISVQGWHLFAVFVSVICGIIFKPFPMGATAFLGLTALALTKTLTFEQVVSSMSGSVVWLVLCAFFIARGFLSSGLAVRLAYRIAALCGSRTLGLAYGMLACDLLLAPAIPSDTARAGGVVYPILKGLAENFGSKPHDPSAKKMGSFLTLTAFHGAIITSAMFLTAMATNPLLASLSADLGHPISWGLWIAAASVPGLVSLCVIPLLLYLLHPPEIKQTPSAATAAKQALEEMGPVSRQEWITVGVFGLLLTLWIFGAQLGISSTVAAMVGVSILIVTKVLDWRQLTREHDAWETFIWFSALITMATYLGEFGVSQWFGERVLGLAHGLKWQQAFPLIALCYFFTHYLFAGNTSHVSALYIPFATIALAIGTPPMLAILTLSFFSSLFASLTHYGTSSGPLLYGAGYVDVRTWWKLGLIVAIVNVTIWLTIGALWWKLLGLY